MTATNTAAATEAPKKPWLLYLFVFLSYAGDRMWTFAIALFMIQLSPGEYEWPAIYGLVVSLNVVLFSPAIGRWVDRTQRWRAARIALAIQNFFVALCCLSVSLTFYFRSVLEYEEFWDEWDIWGHPVASSVIIILGSLAQLGTVTTSIVVTKDWVAVIANGNQEQLAKINSFVRAIDWFTKGFGPVAVGQMFFDLEQLVVAAIIGLWNIVSFSLELFILWRLYKSYPKLAVKVLPNEKDHASSEDADDPENNGDGAEASTENRSKGGSKCWRGFVDYFADQWKSWTIYFNHRVRNAGISLSFLYLTVFGFDAIMSSFSYSQGTPEYMMGVFAGMAVCVGILAFFLYPVLVRYLGVIKTGLFGFLWEMVCLVLCFGSVFAPGSPFDPSKILSGPIHDPFVKEALKTPNSTIEMNLGAPNGDRTSIVLLRAGITSARLGLWMADLSNNQILQGVEDNVRGTINGIQSSLNMSFNVVKFGLVIIFSQPESWGILVFISCFGTSSGLLFYASYTYQRHRQSKRRKSLAPSVAISPDGDWNNRGGNGSLRERFPVRTQVSHLKEKIDSLSTTSNSPTPSVIKGEISVISSENNGWVYANEARKIPGTPGSSGYQSSNEDSSSASNNNTSTIHRRIVFDDDVFHENDNAKRRGKKESDFYVVEV